jgi:uncharacterized phage-associated protein
MEPEMFPLKLRTRFTTGLVENIQQHFSNEVGVDYPRDLVERSLTQWIEDRYDRILEDLGELIVSPHLAEAQNFRRILDENYAAPIAAASATESVTVPSSEEASVFTGGRAFSPEKLGSMIQYLVSRGHDVYKTNLNKLLFYSDLTSYYLYGQGLSGATYLNRPFGPVPDRVETILDDLAAQGSVVRTDMPEFGSNAQKITAAGADVSGLTSEEKGVLDWVLDTYGDMRASDLSDLSHEEKAYKFTRPLEPIAYEYAKFFNKLPSK